MTHAVHISKMTGKLDGFRAISTNTITNKFCIKMNAAKAETICKHCYSHTMLKSYRKNMAPALQRNSDLLSSRPLEPNEVPVILDAVFRFDAHGELINEMHLYNLMTIAERNPHCTFSLWTKRKDIVQNCRVTRPVPANMIFIYSNPKIGKIMDVPPLGFHKTFNNVPEDQDVDRQNCTGQQCKNCLLCYRHDTTDTIVEKVKVY